MLAKCIIILKFYELLYTSNILSYTIILFQNLMNNVSFIIGYQYLDYRHWLINYSGKNETYVFPYIAFYMSILFLCPVFFCNNKLVVSIVGQIKDRSIFK